MNTTPRKTKHTKGKLLSTANHDKPSEVTTPIFQRFLLLLTSVYGIINDTQVHYFEYRPHFCRLQIFNPLYAVVVE
ncbi:hypothetical protein T09_10069 [Trichinella sp. T9]|nr:hypothetical protein T09_10069 [Trichinella sp. T9]